MVNFYELDSVKNEKLEFAVIVCRYLGKFILAKHKERKTWEIPGGHREKNEDIKDTAKRELYEETGALEYTIKPICEYSVGNDEKIRYGRLFFAEVTKLANHLEFEIEKIDFFNELPENLTYPTIQPKLFEKILEMRELCKL